MALLPEWPPTGGRPAREAAPVELASPLPAGTITFLFTDIERSSQLWEQFPESMGEALARHDVLLRRAIAANGGAVFKTIGDEFCAAFSTPIEAVHAALQAQLALQAEHWDRTRRLRVRMALHTGAVEMRAGDYFGPPLNRISRLLDLGHGGQILLSHATDELVRDRLPERASQCDLGVHRLKDLQRPEQVFQLLYPGLPADFPPLRSLDSHPHNLPLQLTRFIGREVEIAVVKQLLSSSRLLTLTGSGGCGKSRLGLQVAADLVEEYPGGVWLVELAALSDPALVRHAVAAALHVREEPDRSLAATLIDHLRHQSLLLILDNCEHLVQACAELAEELLRACPRVQVLATSREALRTSGETLCRVPSLGLPPSEAVGRVPAQRVVASGVEEDQASHNSQRPIPNALTQYEAVRLFIDRAAQSLPEFAVADENAPAIAEICGRLDGIPLAIELAAAQVRFLTLDQIVRRLDDRFRLLTGGSRAALPRQQTLQAAMDWSFHLLAEPEQILLRRLAVFAGGFTLPAAETICGRQGLAPEEIVALLGQLANKSMVVVEEQSGVQGAPPGAPPAAVAGGRFAGGPGCSGVQEENTARPEHLNTRTPEHPISEPRYRLLETVRQYAAEHMRQAGEGPALRGWHRDWYLTLAEQAAPKLEGPRQGDWLARLDQERDNLRAALGWCGERASAEGGQRWLGAPGEWWWVRGSLRAALRGWALGDELVAGLRLGADLGRFWRVRGYWAEGRALLVELLALAGITAPTTGTAAPPADGDWDRKLSGVVRRAARTSSPPTITLVLFGWMLLLVVLDQWGPLLSQLSSVSVWLWSLILWATLAIAWRTSRQARQLKSAAALRAHWWRSGAHWLLGAGASGWVLFVSCAILWFGLWIAAMPGGQLDLLYRRNLLSPGLVLCALLYLVAFGLFGARINPDQQARGRPGVKRLLLFGLPALALPPLVGFTVNRFSWPVLADLAMLALQLSVPLCLLLLAGVAYELGAKLVARAGAPRVSALGAALQGAGQLAAVQGDSAAALALFEEALTLFRLLRRVHEIAATLGHLASVAASQGRDWWEQHLNEAALLIWVKQRDRRGIAAALQRLGATALRQDRLPAACSLLEESLEIRRELGDPDGVASSLHVLGLAALVQDDRTTAHSLFLESLRMRAALGDRGGAAECLEGLAAVAVASQQPERVAMLLGAAEAQREALGLSLPARERAGGIDRVATLLSQTEDAAHAGQRQAGRTMTLAEALALAAQDCSNLRQ